MVPKVVLASEGCSLLWATSGRAELLGPFGGVMPGTVPKTCPKSGRILPIDWRRCCLAASCSKRLLRTPVPGRPGTPKLGTGVRSRWTCDDASGDWKENIKYWYLKLSIVFIATLSQIVFQKNYFHKTSNVIRKAAVVFQNTPIWDNTK